jgi:hypothetical protein
MSDKKSASTRYYIVRDNSTGAPVALIDAASCAQARSHFSKRAHTVQYAEQPDLVEAVKAGIEPEKANSEPDVE